MYQRTFAACLVAGGLCLAGLAIAEDSKTEKSKQDAAQSAQRESTQGKAEQQKRIDAQIEKLSEKVDLTSEQQEKLRSLMTEGQKQSQELWQRFADAHVQVIQREAEMRAALEDGMEPEQQQQVRKNRQAKGDFEATKNTTSTVSNAKDRQSQAKNSSVRRGEQKSHKMKALAPCNLPNNFGLTSFAIEKSVGRQ
ncbi:MAG: hypothetical protein KDB01_08450 [Planctomycetaceae bacterium]|nr:hypothetical protein [Planctomycetaceae bacterium]